MLNLEPLQISYGMCISHRLHSRSFLWVHICDPIRQSQKEATMEPMGSAKKSLLL